MAKLQQTLTADGAGEAWNPAANQAAEVSGHLNMEGDFGGGTLIFESRPVGGANWNPITGMSFTSEQGGTFLTHPGVEYRPSLSGATAPDIDVTYTRPCDVLGA